MPCIVLGAFGLPFLSPCIPFGGIQEVAAGKKGVQVQASEIAHGLQGGAFHFHRDAAVRFMLLEVVDGLPVERIRGPCLSLHVGDAVFFAITIS